MCSLELARPPSCQESAPRLGADGRVHRVLSLGAFHTPSAMTSLPAHAHLLPCTTPASLTKWFSLRRPRQAVRAHCYGCIKPHSFSSSTVYCISSHTSALQCTGAWLKQQILLTSSSLNWASQRSYTCRHQAEFALVCCSLLPQHDQEHTHRLTHEPFICQT